MSNQMSSILEAQDTIISMKAGLSVLDMMLDAEGAEDVEYVNREDAYAWVIDHLRDAIDQAVGLLNTAKGKVS